MAANQVTLTLKLVDAVTAPGRAITGALRGVQGAVSSFNSVALAGSRAIAQTGRNFRTAAYNASGVSVPLSLAGAAAGRAVYEYEKAGNKMQAFGLLAEEQRVNLEQYAQVLNKDFPYTNSQILQAAQELFRAGLTYEQVMGSLRGTLDLGMAGDIALKEASDIATNVMTAMKLPMQTQQQIEESLSRVNDALAYAATKSNTDVRLMGDTFRYVAPLAAAAGMELEEVTALSMELAKAGIKGSEAGVALRSALVRMAKPTKPMLAAFERLNIEIADFVKIRDELNFGDVFSTMLAEGLDLEPIRGELTNILDDKTLQGAPLKMAAALTDAIVKSVGDESVRAQISESITDLVLAGAQDVDLIGLLTTLRDKNATLGDISRIFDVRMGSRLAAILHSDLIGAVDRVHDEYRGVGAQMAALMMQGIVGALARVIAAMENMAIAAAESGVLDAVANAFDTLANAVNNLSQTSPQLLEIGTYALLALAGLAPLGFAASGIAASIALLVNPITWLVGGLAALAFFNWDKIRAGFRGFANAFQENMGPRTTELIDGFLEKFRGLRDAITGGFDVDASSAELFGEAWGARIAGGIEGAIGAYDRFVAAATAAWAEIRAQSDMAVDAISAAWPRIESILGNVWSTIQTEAAAGGAQITQTMRDLEQAGQSFIDGIGGRLPGIMEQWAGLTAKVQPLADALADLGASLTALIRGPDGAGEGYDFDAIGRFIGNLVGSGIETAASTIGLLADSLTLAARGITAISDAMQGKPIDWSGLQAAGLDSLEALGNWIEKIASVLSALTGGGPITIDWSGLASGLQAKLDEIIEWFRTLPQRIGAAIGSIDLGGLISFPEPPAWLGRLLGMGGGGEAASGRKSVSMPPPMAPMLSPRMAERESMVKLRGDASGVEAAVEDAIEALGRVSATTATPHVNTGPLQHALSLANQVSAAVRSIGGASTAAPASPAVAGARAAGGPVQRNLSYLIGEKGPEIFTPGASGYVSPNRALKGRGASAGVSAPAAAGPVTLNQHVTFNVSGSDDPRRLAEMVSREMARGLSNLRQRSMVGGEFS